MNAYPLAALVGCEDVVLALSLCAVDPSIGGVLLRGEKGSGKTTAARGLAEVMPGEAAFIDLPLGAGEDRVVGTFDVAAALGSGEYRFQAGLLHAAHGGVLYVDEVNLLADHLVDVLLDAAATGVHRVERDGISRSDPARFVLVGSMNPEEGDLRPQLLDRFGLSVSVAAPTDPRARAEAVRRRLAFDADPAGFAAEWQERSNELGNRLTAGRAAVAGGSVTLADELVEAISVHVVECGAEGLRADLVTCRAAVACASLEGKSEVGVGEIERVLPLVVGHRVSARRPPPSSSGPSGTRSSRGPTAADDDSGGGSVASSAPSAGTPAKPPDPGPPDPESLDPVPTGLLDPGRIRAGSTAGDTGRRAGPSSGGIRGRIIGAVAPTARGAVATIEPLATIKAAASRGGAPLLVLEEDLRVPVHRPPVANLVVLAVDTSGSMGAEDRIATARRVVQSLLVDAYQRRDRVAVVTFAGDDAEVLLRPTGSTEVAAARLAEVPTGGTTPLAKGIAAACTVATTSKAGDLRLLIVLLTDGRATWAEDESPRDAALRAAEGVRRKKIDALVVDCESGRSRLGLAAEIAAAMGAMYVKAETLEAGGDGLAELVRDRLRMLS